jgi:hypothetical protein
MWARKGEHFGPLKAFDSRRRHLRAQADGCQQKPHGSTEIWPGPSENLKYEDLLTDVLLGRRT